MVCGFPLESVWEGPFPEVGGYGEEKASWGLGVAQLLCSLPLTEDKSDFLLQLKAVRCEGGRFSLLRSKESFLSATLVNELASRQP